MNVRESIVVSIPDTTLWKLIEGRFEEVVQCLPGVRKILREQARRYQITVEVKVGPLGMVFNGPLELVEVNPANAVFRMQSHLTDHRTGSSVKLAQDIELQPQAEGTEIALVSDVELRGKVASLGWALIRPKMRTMMRDFAQNLQAFVYRDAEPSLTSD